ncbi:tyrosine-type recombinase/integrase [Dinoroseobacter sp. S76]|uniref:tyrosine-type recombinase/integrase n=1 Tax=Dinoroseobacter sp. S76 TaxID=3415124 RepID=UPI003C7C15F8
MLDPNTKRDSAHEEKTSVPAGIGKPGAGPDGQNDAILSQWQRYAGKFSEKTLDRHLSAIRQFERFLGGKPFTTLTLEDGHGFRDHLKAALKPGAETPKSPSTVQHLVSHLKDFLAWLGKRKGYRSLPRDLPDALDMPRAVYARALPRAPRTYPDLAEAEALLAQMPKYRAIDLRNRAIFALAFLGALRADALISLRLGDVDCATRRIIQDGRASRTKNGKSLVIAWFPTPKAFGQAVCDWVAFMRRAGSAPEDALFP